MIGAGTILNPILKVVTTVAILGAVYLFIVKPTLDTTEKISDRAFDTSSQIQDSVRDDIERALESAPGATSGIEFEHPLAAEKARKLATCLSEASGDQARVQRCVDRILP